MKDQRKCKSRKMVQRQTFRRAPTCADAMIEKERRPREQDKREDIYGLPLRGLKIEP